MIPHGVIESQKFNHTLNVVHYIDVIRTTMATQITSLTVFYSIVYSGADQRNIKALLHRPLCGKLTLYIACEDLLYIFILCFYMITSSNGNLFRATGPLCGELYGRWWILRTKATEAELWCFFLSAPWMNGWLNNCEVGDLRCHRAYYDIIEMCNGYQSIHEFMSVIKCLIVRKLFEFSTLSFDIVMCSPTHYHTMELTQFMLNEINYLIHSYCLTTVA